MSEATCKTCPFFFDGDGIIEAATCRRYAPTPKLSPVDEGGPADFDWPWTDDGDWCGEHPGRQRDRLAAIAMQGWLASWPDAPPHPQKIARTAYAVADAMLAAHLENKP